MTISIMQPGLMTTIQDSGRVMMAHLGIPKSGFMDKKSAQLANKMVGNDPNLGVLEMSWTGIEFKIEVACSIAVAGAEFNCWVNGKSVITDKVIDLQVGDHFKMKRLGCGVRAYLAVAGGFDVPRVADSQSTLTVAGLGGFKGRALQVGDNIPLRNPRIVKGRCKPSWQKLYSPSILVVRSKPGPEIDLFDPQTIQQAFGQAYHLSNDCNRQGFRLKSKPLAYPKSFSMQSSGLVPGSLQVTPSGQTILAMADAQTTGGYPRILVVNQDELHKLAQARPEQQVYFFVELGF
jgi:biotin-dependent carboxylase-like uncharacterized protein